MAKKENENRWTEHIIVNVIIFLKDNTHSVIIGFCIIIAASIVSNNQIKSHRVYQTPAPDVKVYPKINNRWTGALEVIEDKEKDEKYYVLKAEKEENLFVWKNEKKMKFFGSSIIAKYYYNKHILKIKYLKDDGKKLDLKNVIIVNPDRFELE